MHAHLQSASGSRGAAFCAHKHTEAYPVYATDRGQCGISSPGRTGGHTFLARSLRQAPYSLLHLSFLASEMQATWLPPLIV